jgi:Holliday junction resolvase RusA-like endonuclease
MSSTGSQMVTSVDLKIPGKPTPWRAPFVGKRGAFSPNRKHKLHLKSLIQSLYRGELIDKPILCDIIFYMPIPKSVSKKKREEMISGKIRPAIIPDRTNMCKQMEDVLQGIVIKNDAKIVDGRVAKYYAETPYTLIHIEVI